MTHTKLVRITLAAYTRVEYSEIIEVPGDITPAELLALSNQRYRQVDGGEYLEDHAYWESADPRAEVVAREEVQGIDYISTRGDAGLFTLVDPAASAPPATS